MKLLSLGVTERNRIEICFINLLILFYLFRTAIPLLKFPFLLLYFGFFLYSIANYRKQLISTLIEFVLNYYLLLFLALILIISFLFSNKLYLTIFKDVVNMIILLTIFFISTIVVTGQKEFKYFVSNLVYLIILFATVISILGLLELLDIFSYNDFLNINKVSDSFSYDPITLDYNFALLPVFFGVIGVFYFLLKTNSKFQRVFYNFLLIVFSYDIILSGSRRGLFTFIAILIFLLITQICVFYKKNTLLGKLGSNSKYFLLSVFFLSILSLYITFDTNYSFKIKVLGLIGSKNLTVAKQKISVNIFKYTFKNHNSFPEFYSRIWPTIPEDPDSGWGTRVHKTVFPLTGKNVEIVPNGVKGYFMDSTCNASYYTGSNSSESYTLLVNLKVNKGDQVNASVYCFVSDSFDVNVATFGVGAATINQNIVSGKVTSSYNLDRKGAWQKLEVEFVCNEGEVPIYMSFWKSGVKDFSKLKGYIIFAYPQYKKINKTDNGFSLSVSQSKFNYTELELIDLAKKDVDQKNSESLNIKEKINDKITSHIKAFNKLISSKIIPTRVSSSITLKYFSSCIFCLPISHMIVSSSVQRDQDPVRKLASKFISEDTTYYSYKANIVLDTIANSFVADRVLRWEFALKLFSKEYNLKQKLFGGGFNFLNWYGYYFQRDKTRSDYPHNPFLSILLYSGILGLIVYIIFMFKVFFYYIKCFKEYKILFVYFIITFFFSFFSAGSPFDPPMMGFFVILPFFIHSIYKKDKSEVKSQAS